jgi:Ser/Thr protein kinase RdoA (MazF antagonist)
VSIALESIPRFRAEEALVVAWSSYGIAGPASPLPSERDQNFLLRDPCRGKFVLKIANRDDTPELLDFQHQAMRRIARAGCRAEVPAVVPSTGGGDLASIRDGDGTIYHVRVLSWIEGTVLAEARPRSSRLFESVGASMAEIDRALLGLVHPAMHRVLQWDLRHAGLARDKAHLLPSALRSWVERAFDRWEAIDWGSLRHAVIHGDANDHNVLVREERMTGLLDFGDMVHSAVVGELAIALAYAMLDEPEPLEAAAALIRGYHGIMPLEEAEQTALHPLVHARLAASLCYSAHNRERNPEDAYQVISERAIRALVERLSVYSFDEVSTMIRAACGAPRGRPDLSSPARR